MIDKLEMPIEMFAEAVAKENARLRAALESIAETLDSEEIPYMVRNRYAYAIAKETLGRVEK